MENEIINWVDCIDKNLMLMLNFNGGYVQDCIWQTFSSRLLWILPALMFIVYSFRHYRWPRALSFIFAIALTILLCDRISSGLIKPFFMRLRPSHCIALAGQLHFVDGYRGGMYGFVSSHAANAFGAVTFVALVLRRRKLTCALFLLALLVSYSRIYLGVHYPGDILAGGLLGCFIGYAIYKITFFAFSVRICSPNALSVLPKRSECPVQTLRVSCPNTKSTKSKADLILFALQYMLFRNAKTY